jgi:hypothetical protein
MESFYFAGITLARILFMWLNPNKGPLCFAKLGLLFVFPAF